jgi:hypothetical protein
MKEKLSFRDTAVASDGSLLLLSSIRELDDEGAPHTLVLQCNQQEKSFSKVAGLAWESSLPAFVAGDVARPLVIGLDGQCIVLGTDHHESSIFAGSDDDRTVTAICQHASGVIVAGFDGLVYESADGRHWRRLDASIDADVDFLAVAKDPLLGILAVGRAGAAWLLAGSGWQRLDTPVNVDFTAVIAVDGTWLICGREGLAMRLKGELFEMLLSDPISLDFWGIAHIEGRTFLSSTLTIFELLNGVAVPVETDFDKSFTCCKLRTWGSNVISTGEQDVLRFTNGRWIQEL